MLSSAFLDVIIVAFHVADVLLLLAATYKNIIG
jgi:hypothetical protein